MGKLSLVIRTHDKTLMFPRLGLHTLIIIISSPTTHHHRTQRGFKSWSTQRILSLRITGVCLTQRLRKLRIESCKLVLTDRLNLWSLRETSKRSQHRHQCLSTHRWLPPWSKMTLGSQVDGAAKSSVSYKTLTKKSQKTRVWTMMMILQTRDTLKMSLMTN